MQTTEKYKNAWLIGASGCIGNSIIGLLSEYTENIYGCDKKAANHQSSSSKYKFRKVDCAKIAQIEEFAKETLYESGSPDLMVITAGYVSSVELMSTSEKELEEIFVNNFKLVVVALKTFFKNCAEDKNIMKNIIILSSNAGFLPRPNQPIYAAMKSAVNNLVISQAVSWGKFNIRVNAIAPGTVVVPRNIESLKQKFKDFPLDPTRPLGLIASPENLCSAFRYFLDRKSFVTGQILVVDGGSSLV